MGSVRRQPSFVCFFSLRRFESSAPNVASCFAARHKKYLTRRKSRLDVSLERFRRVVLNGPC